MKLKTIGFEYGAGDGIQPLHHPIRTRLADAYLIECRETDTMFFTVRNATWRSALGLIYDQLCTETGDETENNRL